jgi:F0F1-type ATP synthase, alpha subunit
LELSQYRELAAFAQFGSDLDKATQARLIRGQRTVEILKQGQYSPMPVEEQVVVIYAATQGYLDDLDLKLVSQFEKGFLNYLRNEEPDILEEIRTTRDLSAQLEEKLKAAIKTFKERFVAQQAGA